MNDDWPVIERVLAGDREAYRVLVERHAGPLFGYVSNLADRHDAEDVVQDVLLAAYDRLASYDPARGRFATWLFTIARHRCVDLLRRARPSDGPPPERSADGTAEDDAVRHEFHARLDAALAALPVEQRSAFVLAEVQGHSYAEVAAIEGVPVGTVKSRIARARGRLRGLLPHPSERLP